MIIGKKLRKRDWVDIGYKIFDLDVSRHNYSFATSDIEEIIHNDVWSKVGLFIIEIEFV